MHKLAVRLIDGSKQKTTINKCGLFKVSENKKPDSDTISFVEQDIDFLNPVDGIKLSGTLSIPNSGTKHPCVILISGSGAHTRDQVVLGHKTFKDVGHVSKP